MTGTSTSALPAVVRTGAKVALRRYGMATARLRPLPDFLIIGTKRGGTTSLWNYLIGHPLVLPMFPSRQRLKSNAYFYENHARGLGWYRSHFATTTYRARLQRRTGHAPMAGDASPYYMYDPRVAERVRAIMPEIKIIVQLRDPVARAYSHYHERINAGVESLSFEAALAAEERRLRGERERIIAEPDYYSRAHDWYSYRDRGVYAPQMAQWLGVFPRTQVHVMRSEDLYAYEQATFDRVVDFLGLPRREMSRIARHNYRPAEKMLSATRAELVEFYRPHNALLYDLLGRDMGWQT